MRKSFSNLGDNQKIKPKETEILSTGLHLIINEQEINKIWKHDKPKTIITEFLNNFFKKSKINQNFETMEINIVAEFHLYNLIFA